MNRHDDLDRMLSAWLDDPLTPPAPRYLDKILERTRQTPQRPAWASLERWLPMTVTLRNPALPVPRRILVIGLSLLLALLMALTSLSFLAGALLSPAPEGTTSSGLIAFERDGDIYVVDPPDGEPRLLVGGPEEDVGPLWSPDGRHLLFFRITEEGEFPMLTDELGTTPVALVHEPLVGAIWVNWAPDSSALVLSSELERIDEPGATAPMLSIVPADGSGDVRHLRNRPGPGADFPAWRPRRDGAIELLYRKRGDPGELWYVQIRDDGGAGGVALGVEDMAGQRTDGWDGQYDFLDAAWAPDGDRFAYHTLNDVEGAPDGNGFRIHVARFAPRSRPVVDTMLEFDPQADDEGWPVWSPDGSRIAFESYDQGMARLVIMPVPDAAGPASDTAVVATTPIPTWAPGRLGFAWAPDGSTIILVNQGPGPGDGGNAHLVHATTGELESLAWRADDWPSWQYGTSR
jgi:hypothetical protein